MKKFDNIILRYGLATFGLLFVALGVALSIISNLGTSPLSAPSYVLSPLCGGAISVGSWTIIVNCCYIFVQLGIFRKKFRAKYLMQIPASVVFGYLIDFCLFCFSWLHPTGFISRLIILMLSCLVTAFGVSIEVVARGWMLSAEMTVYAISKTYGRPFDRVKIAMDCCLVLISSGVAFLLFRNPFGFGEFQSLLGVVTGQTAGVVIGVGTILMAIFAGGFMKFTDPLANKLLDKIFERKIKKYHEK